MLHSASDSTTVALHQAKGEPLCESCRAYVRRVTGTEPTQPSAVDVTLQFPIRTYYALEREASDRGFRDVATLLTHTAEALADGRLAKVRKRRGR